MNKEQTLILIRGLPGSGKTTKAFDLCNKDPDLVHLEADMFHCDLEGKYNYKDELSSLAHQWCLSSTALYLNRGKSVVVSNTFITAKEMEPYFRMAKLMDVNVQIMACHGDFDSVHNVPRHVINYMKARLQPQHKILAKYTEILIDKEVF